MKIGSKECKHQLGEAQIPARALYTISFIFLDRGVEFSRWTTVSPAIVISCFNFPIGIVFQAGEGRNSQNYPPATETPLKTISLIRACKLLPRLAMCRCRPLLLS